MCRLADHQIQAGCTAVVCVLTPHDIIVANAGDSRAVLCRAGTAMALSADHKPNQVPPYHDAVYHAVWYV
jgi:serine/threonine protein phosphatase PrpC